MNRKWLYLSGLFLLINFACQKEIKQTAKDTQKSTKKYSFVVKRNTKLTDYEDIKKLTEKNPAFIKILESFQPETYSLDELIDLTEKDLKKFKTLKIKKFQNQLDTAAVKSRMVLTEVYINKLNFLIHKKKPQKDSISRTLNAIIVNLNNVLDQMRIYSQDTDEFESILKHDSIAKQAKLKANDSINLKNIPNDIYREKIQMKKQKFIKNSH